MNSSRRLKSLYSREFTETMSVSFHLAKELKIGKEVMLKVAPSSPYSTEALVCKPFEKYGTRFSDLNFLQDEGL